MITLYSTHCPQCKALEMKLNKKKVQYDICDNEQEMLKLGFKAAPILKVGDNYFSFAEAIKWVNAQP